MLWCCSSAGADTAAEIASAVKRFAVNRVHADSVSVFVSNVQQNSREKTPRFIAVEWKRSIQEMKGRIVVPVRLVFHDNTSELVYVTTDVRVYTTVTVAARTIHRNSTVGYADLRTELRDITDLRSLPAAPEQLISNVRATRTVTAGRIITLDMIEPEPVIRRGDKVMVVARCNNLRVTTYGIAREDGWKGKRIRIKTTGARRELYAEVSGPSVVTIEL